MVFHKKYFWFFFRWKEFVCETELKTLFQNLFSLSCVKSNWNQVKVSFSMCENKKNFFSAEKLFFFFLWVKTYFPWTRPTERLYFHMWNPQPEKNFILRRTFFFFQQKKSLFSRKSFLPCYVWNRDKTFFSTVKPRDNMFWTCETKKNVFSGEKRIILFNVL